MENKELNLNEMENVSGGTGGSKYPLPHKDGCDVYRIEKRSHPEPHCRPVEHHR